MHFSATVHVYNSRRVHDISCMILLILNESHRLRPKHERRGTGLVEHTFDFRGFTPHDMNFLTARAYYRKSINQFHCRRDEQQSTCVGFSAKQVKAICMRACVVVFV